MAAVFNRLGPYEIHEEIGRGGMASVLLATDTRTTRRVALRLVSAREAADVLDAERRGAELLDQFCRVSTYVPELYERGSEGSYLYVAMEYLDGESLADAIRRGPLPHARAVSVAIELCRFLEDASRFHSVVDGREIRHLLHGDLTPANIRITSDGRVKVLDFGIAKALSLSRKVTRNDFGSIPYLSPERLESAGEMDATDGFWALGVMLYEMMSGDAPFRAPDTRRLEQLIRSRRSAPTLDGLCPIGLQAVVAKLLGPTPADRYDRAEDIRSDLERCQSGERTRAELDGWPSRAADEPVTRRTIPSAPDEATRRTAIAAADPALATVPPGPSPAVASPAAAVVAAGGGRAAGRSRNVLRTALLVLTVLIVINEIGVTIAANRAASTVPAQELPVLPAAWTRYHRLTGRSLGLGTLSLQRSLKSQTLSQTDRVIGTYRVGASTVWEPDWRMAREALAPAVAADPGDSRLRASLRYVDGHLHRINGDARKGRKQTNGAQQEFSAAIAAFREAAQLRSDWPDPFLGLARTFISGLADLDRGRDALNQAERLGHAPGERETAQLAEGYRERADSLATTARQLRGMPQEAGYLSRAADDYGQSLALFSRIVNFGSAARSIRTAQRSLDRVQERLDELNHATGRDHATPLVPAPSEAR